LDESKQALYLLHRKGAIRNKTPPHTSKKESKKATPNIGVFQAATGLGKELFLEKSHCHLKSKAMEHLP
jgi:hypothetical protein